jgi:hypothetical protein
MGQNWVAYQTCRVAPGIVPIEQAVTPHGQVGGNPEACAEEYQDQWCWKQPGNEIVPLGDGRYLVKPPYFTILTGKSVMAMINEAISIMKEEQQEKRDG